MSAALIASLSLVAMLLLIWCGMHVAVVLATVSFIGVWLIKGNVEVAANLLAQGGQRCGRQPHLRRRAAVRADRLPGGRCRCRQGRLRSRQPVVPALARRARRGHGGGECGVRGDHRHLHRLGRGVHARGGAADAALWLPQRLCHRRGGGLVGAGHADSAQPADDPVRLPVEPVGGRHVHRRHRAGPAAGAGLRGRIVVLAYLRPGMVFVGGRPLPVAADDR